MIGRAIAVAADRLGADAPRVLARIAGSIGDQARAAASELARVTGSAHKTQRATWAALARAPTPPGLRGIDPTWIEAALDGLPERARTAVGSGSGDEIDVWLARWVCAGFPAMPPIANVRWPRSVEQAIALDRIQLHAWLDTIGLDQVAAVAASAGDARLLQGSRSLSDLAATERIARPPRAGGLGPVRASIARCSGVALADHGLARIGARTIAPLLDVIARRQLMLRLPRPIGLIVGRELTAFASQPVEQCPTWTALAAS